MIKATEDANESNEKQDQTDKNVSHQNIDGNAKKTIETCAENVQVQ